MTVWHWIVAANHWLNSLGVAFWWIVSDVIWFFVGRRSVEQHIIEGGK